MDNIINLINTHKVISFDLFDTLLLRPYLNPTDLFEHIERLFNVTDYKKNRIEAEKKARTHNYSREEITLDDIYEFLPREYCYLKQEELNLEKKVLIPNKEMISYFEYAKKSNKKVIITSDMYLPYSFIEDCLKEKGITGYDRLYLSSDIGKQKIKTLFPFIFKEENIQPKDLFHIGDNENCDYLKPLSLGADSFYYKSISNQFFENNPKAKHFYNENKCFETSVFFKTLANFNNSNRQLSYEERFGFEYAGLAYLVFSEWINKQGQKDNISDYIFVARDGYILKKIYDFLYPYTSTKYVYANRLLHIINSVELAVQKKKCLFLLVGLAQAGKISSNDIKLINNENDALTYVNTNYEKISKICQDNYNEYTKYINNLKISGKKIAIIDTDSTLQNLSALKLLEPLLNKNNTSVKLYVWSLIDLKKNDVTHITEYKNEQIRTMTEKLSFEGYKEWVPLEMIMSSPEPPIVGIQNLNPIYLNKTDSEELKREKALKDIERYALEFVKTIKGIFGNTISFNEKFFKEWWNLLFNFIDKNDFNYWKKANYSMDQIHSNKVSPCNKSLIPEIIEKLLDELNKFKIKQLYLYCANDITEVVLPLLESKIKEKELEIKIPFIFDQNAENKFLSDCNIPIKTFSNSLLKDKSAIFILSTTVDHKIKEFLNKNILNKNTNILIYALNDLK